MKNGSRTTKAVGLRAISISCSRLLFANKSVRTHHMKAHLFVKEYRRKDGRKQSSRSMTGQQGSIIRTVHRRRSNAAKTTLKFMNFCIFVVHNKSRVSSVGIVNDYGLDYRMSGVRIPAGAGNLSLHHCVQTGSGAHPASYPMGTRGSFPGGKAHHSPPSSAEVKECVQLYVHSPSTFSWRGA
jgi:hypothetical protein